MAQLKVLYKPGPVGRIDSFEDLQQYLRQELDSISQGFFDTLPRNVEFLTAAPAKLREGMTVGADGTNWNPGSGKGVYTYYSAAWHKLG